jgi:hypothetical protein
MLDVRVCTSNIDALQNMTLQQIQRHELQEQVPYLHVWETEKVLQERILRIVMHEAPLKLDPFIIT